MRRLITKINTCIDELVAFCPDMLKVKEDHPQYMLISALNQQPITKSYLEVVDHLEELAVGYEEDGDWDTEKCPGAT